MNNLNNSKMVVDFPLTQPKVWKLYTDTLTNVISKPDGEAQVIKLNGLINYLSHTKFKHPVINLTQFKDICNNLHLEFYQFARFLATKYKIPLLLTDYIPEHKQKIIEDNKGKEKKRLDNKGKELNIRQITKKRNGHSRNSRNSRNSRHSKSRN